MKYCLNVTNLLYSRHYLLIHTSTKPVMRKGIVTHIDPVFRKGFIEDENGQDIFFDLDEMHGNLNNGDSVKFQIILGPDGLVASDVEALVETDHFNVNVGATPLEYQQ